MSFRQKFHWFSWGVCLFLLVFSSHSYALVECPGYELETRPFTFAGYNPPPQVIGGNRFPRLTQTSYRSIPLKQYQQFTLPSTIAAMLGDRATYIGSHTFSDLRLLLMSVGTLTEQSRHQLDQLMVLPFLQTLLQCVAVQGAFSYEDAGRYAADLMDKSFRALDLRGVIASRFLDYNAASYDNWPEPLIFSTYFPLIAGYYGRSTVIIRDQGRRSLDLNYWNYHHSQLWSANNGDLGEVLIPGYIPGNDIAGFMVRSHDGAFWEASTNIDNLIQYSFHRVRWDGRDYVLVLDVRNQGCVLEAAGQRFVYCSEAFQRNSQHIPVNDPRNSLPLNIDSLGMQEVPVLGVIAVCAINESCVLDPSILGHYPLVSPNQLPRALLQQISTVRVNGRSVDYTPFYNNAASPLVSHVMSAELDGVDVISELRSVCNPGAPCLSILRRISRHSSFWGPQQWEGPWGALTVQWSCGANNQIFIQTVNSRTGFYQVVTSCPGPLEMSGSSVDRAPGFRAGIQVEEATYGGNISQARHGNLTELFQSRCQGQTRCSSRLNGGSEPALARDLRVVWSCGQTGRRFVLSIPEEAEGHTVQLLCP